MDDVASWNVCYKNREAFDAANMPTTCVNTGSADVMTADVMMSTAPGQYTVYFAVVPVDALGNTGTAGSSSDAGADAAFFKACLLYTSPSPRDLSTSRMPSSA